MQFVYVDIIIALAAVFLLGAFFTLKGGLHAALTPLCVLALYSTLLTLGGIAHILKPTALALYAVSFVLGIWAITCDIRARKRAPAVERRALAARLLPPSALVFWLLTLAFGIYFSIRKPMFSLYDEYSFWGTAAKLTSTQDVLFAEAKIGWPWQATQNCGLITLSYFFQLFGKFAAWKVHLTYDILLFACFAAVVGTMKWNNYSLAFPMAISCWLTPFVFSVAERQIYVCHVYMLAYGDIPAGVVFGGAVAFWLALRKQKGPYWALLPVLALAANIKSNTFVLSLAAAGIVAVDIVLFNEKAPWRKGIAVRLGKAAGAFSAPMGLYAIWSRYTLSLALKNAEGGGFGVTDQDLITVAFSGIKMLLGMPVDAYYEQRRERFMDYARQIWNAFFGLKVTMLGTGVRVVLIMGVIALWAILLVPGWRRKIQFALVWGLTAACFAGYNFMLLLSYAFIFNDVSGTGLVDYNRYLCAFYLGWFLITLSLLCLAARETRWRLLGGGSILGLACLLMLGMYLYIHPQLSVIGYDSAEFAEARGCQREVEAVVDAIEVDPSREGKMEEQRLFLITQGDDGQRWFQFSYEFLPVMLQYGSTFLGGGGGTYGTPENYDQSMYYHAYSTDDFFAYLHENCDYLFIENIDDIFSDSYAELFGDIRSNAPRGMALYRVTDSGLEWVANIEVAA
jgi:hypothetical protein